MLDINKQENLSLTPLDFSPVRMNMDKIPEERIDIICSQIVNYANSLQIMTTADLKDLSPDCIDQELRHNFIDAIYNGNMNSALRIVDEQIDLLIELHEMLEERKTAQQTLLSTFKELGDSISKKLHSLLPFLKTGSHKI